VLHICALGGYSSEQVDAMDKLKLPVLFIYLFIFEGWVEIDTTNQSCMSNDVYFLYKFFYTLQNFHIACANGVQSPVETNLLEWCDRGTLAPIVRVPVHVQDFLPTNGHDSR